MHYFDHDTTASGDDKVMALRLEHGGAAVDAYWCLLEKIYDAEGPINLTKDRPLTKAVSHRLAVGFDELEPWVSSMVSIGLFERPEGDPEGIVSKRATEAIERMNDKREKARLNGRKGGRKTNAETKSVSRRKPSASQAGSREETERKALRPKPRPEEKLNAFPSGTEAAGAAAAKAAPPLPAGWERTGVICSHAGCKALQLRDHMGTLWCPECDAGELSMMGVVA